MRFPEARVLFDDALQAVGFFTRFPAPRPLDVDRAFADRLWAAPLAGIAVALAGWLGFAIATSFGMPATVAVALALAATMLASGGLHEDGLADVADGFGGGATPDDKLAIMKDSRIGTYGVAALTVSLLLRWSALAAIAASGPVFAALMAAHVSSRAVLPLLLHALPNARPDGLAAGVGSVSRQTAVAALAIGALALLAGLGIGGGMATAFAVAIVFCGVGVLAMRQVGGQTGDVAGGLQQAVEVTVLCAAAALLA